MASGEIDQQRHKFWLSVEFLKVYVQKKIETTIVFVDFTKAFDSIHRGSKFDSPTVFQKKPSQP